LSRGGGAAAGGQGAVIQAGRGGAEDDVLGVGAVALGSAGLVGGRIAAVGVAVAVSAGAVAVGVEVPPAGVVEVGKAATPLAVGTREAGAAAPRFGARSARPQTSSASMNRTGNSIIAMSRRWSRSGGRRDGT
jgi:hypothetical protein